MNKPIVIYDEARGKILAKYVENFGKVCEVDVTDQTMEAVFRYLMAYGLTLNEHYEYEFDGDKFSTRLVKKEPTVDPVKQGKWLLNKVERYIPTTDENGNVDIEIGLVDQCECSVCHRTQGAIASDWNFCPECGAKMGGDGK